MIQAYWLLRPFLRHAGVNAGLNCPDICPIVSGWARPYRHCHMDPNQALTVTLRIVSAIVDRRQPESEDVTNLRNLAESDEERGMPLDELVCAVMLRERSRSKSRARAASWGR